MASSSVNFGGNGLLIVPRVADPTWIAEHGAPSVDIIAVHGLNGGRWSTWTEGNTMWLQDLLPFKLTSARIMTFGYNADVVGNFSTLQVRDHSRKLLSLLRDKRSSEAETIRPIVFLCHSLGGIIVKQALRIATNEERYNPIATATKGIVFFGTPHRGADLAFWGEMLARLGKACFLRPPKDLIKDLRNNSKTVMDVSEDFRSIVDKYAIVSFYEEDKLHGIDKEVVPKSSALMEVSHEDAIPLEGNHMKICKFSGEQDERFEQVWKAIERVINTGPRQSLQLTDAENKILDHLHTYAKFKRMSHFSKTAKPLEGTFAWVLEHESYEMWLNSPSASILHIFGKPGSGKSLLSQFLFQKTISTLQWTPCAYFNCSVTENRRSSLQLYASLLHQLFLAFPRLLRWVSQTLQEEINYEPEDDDAGLQGVLEQSIIWLQGKSNVLLVVDGLDECDTGRYEVIHLFRRLQKDAPWCRILLTSRHDESLLSDLGNDTLRLNLDKEPGLQRDIGALIGFEVQLLVRDQPFLGPLANEIQKILEERADGMFLLVRLIIFDLRNRKGSSPSKLRSSPAEVRKILKSLPKSLWQAYANMLDRVNYDDQNLAKRILSCVLYSARPLTVEELSIALAVSDEIESINELEDEISLSLLHDLHHVFGPLLQVEDGYITFMHASVRDFLLSSSGTTLSAGVYKSSFLKGLRTLFKAQPWYSILKMEGNAVLLGICFNYLDLASRTLTDYSSITADMFRDEAPENDDDFFLMAEIRDTRSNQQLLRNKALKLLSYTAENMDEHCREISSSDSQTRLMVRKYFTSRSIDFWIALYWIFRDRERMRQHLGPLHMACLLGLELTVEDLLNNGWIWKTPTIGALYGQFTTPLEMAVEGGDCGTVKMLLKHGAALDWHYKENRSILSTAAWYGHNEIIGILLEHGAKLVGDMEHEYTALDAAVEAGRESTTLYLLDCAKKAGMSSWSSGYPLHTAVRAGRTSILQLLLEKQFPIDVHDNNGLLPFHVAASKNDVTILGLCKPSDIDHETESGETALQIAAQSVNKANLEYLLDNGAAINPTEALNTALSLAIDASSSAPHEKVCDVMRFLLGRGAIIDQSSIDSAVKIDNALALKLLLAQTAEAKLDCNVDWVRSLLHLIIESRAIACLVMFLDEFTPEERETLLKHPDVEGFTALHIVAQNPDQAILERLLKEVVSVNAVDLKGRTPLHLILEYETPYWWTPPLSLVETLLNHGADPNVTSNKGVSALGSYLASHDATDADAEAIYKDHVWTGEELKLIELLIDRGAKFTFDDFTISTRQGRFVRSIYWPMVTMESESVNDYAKRFLVDDKLTEDQRRQGLVWALSNSNELLVNMLSSTLPEWIFEEELGIQLMTAFWHVSSRTIDMILGYPALNLSKAYKTRDQKRGPAYLLCEAAERGLKRVVAKMLETPSDSPRSASLKVLKNAEVLAWKEKHEEVAAMIRQYRTRRVDGYT